MNFRFRLPLDVRENALKKKAKNYTCINLSG